jgi:hypothetical protein
VNEGGALVSFAFFLFHNVVTEIKKEVGNG